MATDDAQFRDELAGLLHTDPIIVPSARPLAPPSFDVMGVIRRQRTRQRRIAASAGAAVALVALGAAAAPILSHRVPPAEQPPTPGITIAPTVQPDDVPLAHCTVAPLTLPGAGHAEVWAMDPTGRYVLGGDSSREVILDLATGKTTTLPAAVRQVVRNLIGDGTVIGVMRLGADGTIFGDFPTDRESIYRNGHMISLPVPDGRAGVAADANAHGDIVGLLLAGQDAHQADLMAAHPVAAVEWTAASPDRMRVLSSAPNSGALTIADDGRIGGRVAGMPYIWNTNGTGQRLSFSYPGAYQGSVTDIVGTKALGFLNYLGPQGQSADPNYVRVVWDLTTGIPTYYAFPNFDISAQLSSRGTMLANWSPPADQPATSSWGGLVTLDGQLARLPALSGTSAQPARAWQMSTDGRTIIGNNNEQSFIWRC